MVSNCCRWRRYALTVGLLCTVALAWLPRAGAADAWLVAISQRDTLALAALLEEQTDVDHSAVDGRTALMMAAARGDLQLLERLLAAGADVNRRNRGAGTALMFAAQYGETACAGRLITSGADPNLVGVKGYTALSIAVLKARQPMVDLLLANGADPNLADVHGWTPLQRAVDARRADLVSQLLAHAATDVDHRNDTGATALHLAASSGQSETVRELLQHGADPRLRDEQGKTAAAFAIRAGHTQVAETLRTAMGRNTIH
jgi:ankyrin repeat protein